MEPRKSKNVYTITYSDNVNSKGYWTLIGKAWENKDGSFNITLNALPLNGKLHVRDAEDKEIPF